MHMDLDSTKESENTCTYHGEGIRARRETSLCGTGKQRQMQVEDVVETLRKPLLYPRTLSKHNATAAHHIWSPWYTEANNSNNKIQT